MLGACIGIDRDDIESRQALNASFTLTVRADRKNNPVIRITDYHTVLDARKVDGSARKDAIVSQREYLCDAEFTLALSFHDNAEYGIDDVKKAVQLPRYTPFLGRRSCPIYRPLLWNENAVIGAENVEEALKKVEPYGGTIYSERELPGSSPIRIRDVPMPTKVRQFATRQAYILGDGGDHVSE